MSKLTKYLAVSGAILGLGIGAAWAADAPQQKARDQKAATEKSATERAKTDLRAVIASPITGEFAAGARIGWGMQPEVGGYNGSGFLNSTGMPSGTPGNPY